MPLKIHLERVSEVKDLKFPIEQFWLCDFLARQIKFGFNVLKVVCHSFLNLAVIDFCSMSVLVHDHFFKLPTSVF